MKQLFNSFGIILFLLAIGGNVIAQNDFIGSSPTTKQYNDLCYPIQAGKSIKVPITVTCNITKKYQPYKVSIDMNSFNGYYGWVTINNNSQNVDSSKTITFNLTITPPKTPNFTVDGQYPFKLYFIVYNKDNTQINSTFTLPEFKVIVDNTPPSKPNISVQTKKSNYLSIQGCSSVDPGALSYSYSLVNDTAGIMGIEDLFFMITNTTTNKTVSKKDSVENTQDWYAFRDLTPNTTYKTSIATTDLAGNKNTSNVLTVTTPPAPPDICTIIERTYCSVTLQWPSSQGATGYYVYNESNQLISASLITTNSYKLEGLTAGTTYKFYIKAYSDAGGISEVGPLFSTSTLAIPTPVFSSALRMCANRDANIQVDPIAFANSYTWTISEHLSPTGVKTTTNPSIQINADETQGIRSISVYANLTCGLTSNTKLATIQVGGPPVLDFNPPLAYFDGSAYNSVCNSQNYITNLQTSGTVTWSRISANPTNTSWYQSGNDVNFYFYYVNQTAVFRVNVYNSCGSASGDFGFKSINCGGGGGGGGGGCNAVYSLSPNPSKDKVKIVPQIPAPCPQVATSSKSGYVSVYDQQGTLKKKIKYNFNSEAEIDVTDLKNGFYIVEINDGNTTNKQTIMVKH